jgi:ABC-2 type transport system ATP-binding protein
MIETHALTKRYGSDVLAVDQLELNVRQGEIYGFLGPNGAGKSTTLGMLLGLVAPTSGSALVAGHAPGHPAGLRQLGALIETPAFYPYLSGRRNLIAFARLAGASIKHVDQALATVGLSGAAKRRVSTYSQGMRQRLGVAGALLKDPPLLILDEPSNGLDPQGVVEVRDLLLDLRRQGRTVVFSSHLLGEVEQVCDRVGVVSKGRLVAEGTLNEIRGASGGTLVRAEPADRARQLIAERWGADSVTADAGGALRVAQGDAADVNQALVGAGIRVSELRPIDRSLEDVFLELTGPGGPPSGPPSGPPGTPPAGPPAGPPP